jgi:hypothetical protein
MNVRINIESATSPEVALARKTEAILTRGPGRLVLKELNGFFASNPDRALELDFGTHVIKIERINTTPPVAEQSDE